MCYSVGFTLPDTVVAAIENNPSSVWELQREGPLKRRANEPGARQHRHEVKVSPQENGLQELTEEQVGIIMARGVVPPRPGPARAAA